MRELPDRHRSHDALARGADRAAGWLFYVVLGALAMLVGAGLGFVVCLYLIMALYLGEQPLAVAPAEMSWAGAVAGAVLAGVAYAVMLRRRR